MSKDPLGFMARVNAMSLMLITPEFYKIRRLRSAHASKIDDTPAQFSIKPEKMQIDALEIRYSTSRKPKRPTILFLSPLPQSLYCYDAVWSLLLNEFDLVALDLPGFGGSEGRMDQMNFAAQSAFLEKFIDITELSDVHIVAPDIAMPVALHYVIHRKHKAKTLILGDGPGILPSFDGSLIRKIVGSSFWRSMVKFNGAKTFIAGAFQLGYLHYQPKSEEVVDYVNAYCKRIGQVTEFFKNYPEGQRDLTDHIGKANLAVQVFWADHDAFLTSENAHALHARLPESSLHIFENCGHFCYQDQSGAFAEMIRDWISSKRR